MGWIAFAGFGDLNNPIRYALTHCHTFTEISERIAGSVEDLTHCPHCLVVERRVMVRQTAIHSDLP
jgi:hypothetical protein